MDKISAHLKFASRKLSPLVAFCFTGFIVHGILLDSVVAVMFVPVIKDKVGKNAFDCVNHEKQFYKSYNRGVPKSLVRVLSFSYARQSVHIKWVYCVSAPFLCEERA